MKKGFAKGCCNKETLAEMRRGAGGGAENSKASFVKHKPVDPRSNNGAVNPRALEPVSGVANSKANVVKDKPVDPRSSYGVANSKVNFV